MFTRILVPLDGEPEAEAAIEPALELAKRFGGTLHLLEVTPGYGSTFLATVSEAFGASGSVDAAEEREEIREAIASSYLEGLGPRIEGADVVARIAHGDSASTIADYAASEGIDLIVMATHSRSRVERLFLSSVTEDVIRRCHVPVLVIHAEE